jgi:hypothetical protein
MTHTHKVCACCKGCKPVAKFHRMAATSDGLQGYCKACMKLKISEYQKRRRLEDSAPRTVATRQKWAAIAQEAARL